jgi:hypothetical protein
MTDEERDIRPASVLGHRRSYGTTRCSRKEINVLLLNQLAGSLKTNFRIGLTITALYSQLSVWKKFVRGVDFLNCDALSPLGLLSESAESSRQGVDPSDFNLIRESSRRSTTTTTIATATSVAITVTSIVATAVATITRLTPGQSDHRSTCCGGF